jgi:hypothetical protein
MYTVLKISIIKIYEDLSSIDTSLDTSGSFGLEGVVEGFLDPLDRDIDPITAKGPLLGFLEFTRPFSGSIVSARSILDPLEEPLLGLPTLFIEGDPLEGFGELEDIGPILGPTKLFLEGLGLTLSKEIDLLYAK